LRVAINESVELKKQEIHVGLHVRQSPILVRPQPALLADLLAHLIMPVLALEISHKERHYVVQVLVIYLDWYIVIPRLNAVGIPFGEDST